MIKIFESTATNFTSNGIITIKPLKAIETKKQSLNGWFLDVSIPIKYRDYIEQDTIVVAKVKGSLNPQAFRVNNITYTKRTIDFTTDHIVFDTKYLLIQDTRPTNSTAQYALVNANDNTEDPSNFTFTSNVGGSNTAYFQDKSLLEAMDIIQERWGGKYVIDNFNISLDKSPGYDNGEIISYGKNLEDIKVFEDWSNVVTKMKPRGFDGITLPEVFLYSEQTYDQPYTKTIKFDTEIDEEDRTDELLIEELREISLAYIEENQFPKVSYEVKSDINQDLDIYDTVTVKHPIVTLTTEVQEYEYNLNTKRVIKIVFGNYNRDVKKRFDTIKDDISKNKDQMNKVEDIVGKQTDLINSMNKFGYVYIDDNQIMILDKLPKENAKNVWRWNLGGLGFSNNGIEGPFKLAWTIDGVFNTDFIAANTIKVSHLHSDVGSSLDLSSNTSINLIVKDIEKSIENIELTPGPKGDKGDTGAQGIPGQKGQDGKTTYTWIKYADSPTSGMSDLPDNKKYMGIAVNKDTPTESTNYSDYSWAKFEGPQGGQGIPGAPGADGKPNYTWYRYADTPTTGISTSPEGKKYIGLAFNKETANASNTYSDYEWSFMPQNITVGGRNLLYGFKKNQMNTQGIITGNEVGWLSEMIEWKINDQYIFTVKDETSTQLPMFIFLFDENDLPIVRTSGNIWLNNSVINKETFVTYVNENNEKDLVRVKTARVYLYNLQTQTPVYELYPTKESILIKLERGDIPTGWSPAPEDIDEKIYDLEGNVGSIIETTTEMAARINLNSESIENEVERSTKQGDELVEQTKSLAEQLADSFTLIFEQMEKNEVTEEGLDLLSTYFRFDINGAIVGKTGSPITLHTTNDGIEIRDNGIVIAYWKEGTMSVDYLITKISIVIGTHSIDKYFSPIFNDTTTTVRYTDES